ncbi:MAG: hypothetical protein U5L10_01165 [Candidatus Moranbacteria bacterium]|nr:hypothetical protein [Candidatus Moranbacteria bacterium]
MKKFKPINILKIIIGVVIFIIIIVYSYNSFTTKNWGKSGTIKNETEKIIKSPSERALSVATEEYLEFITEDKERRDKYFSKYSEERKAKEAILNRASYLDKNIEDLIFIEKLTEKKKARRKNTSQKEITEKVKQTPTVIDQSESMLEKLEQEEAQECQKEITKYNACLTEYSAKMAEYNACLSESADPNSYRYNSYCSEPFNLCIKPSCAY